MALVDMKGAVPKPAETASIADPGEQDAYPWGLRLCFGKEALARLNLDQLPAIGASMSVRAVASVVSISEEQMQDGTAEKRLELQIEQIELVPGAPDRMYPSMVDGNG